MIIEFNGLPGTGKTTIANHLYELLKDRYNIYFKCILEESRLKRYFSYLFDGSLHLYYLAVLYVIKSTDSYTKEKLKIASLLVAYYRMYKYFLKNEKRNDILLIDQGIIQALVSINFFDKIKGTNEIDKIFKFLNKKDISFSLVCCRCNAELSKQRIKQRNLHGGRLDNSKEDERKGILDIQGYNFNLINDIVKDLKILEIINVDTMDSPEINAELIAKKIGLLEYVKKDESC